MCRWRTKFSRKTLGPGTKIGDGPGQPGGKTGAARSFARLNLSKGPHSVESYGNGRSKLAKGEAKRQRLDRPSNRHRRRNGKKFGRPGRVPESIWTVRGKPEKWLGANRLDGQP